MPGSLANASMRRATGSITADGMETDRLHPGQSEATGHGGHLRFAELPGSSQGIVDRGDDEVLEHLDVRGIHRAGVDLDAQELLFAGHGGSHDAAAGRPFEDRGRQLLLDALHVLLHLERHLREIAEAHPYPVLRRPPHGAPPWPESATSRRGAQARRSARACQSTSRTPTSSSPHTARAAAMTAEPSGSAGGATSISTLGALQRTAMGRPNTRERPSSRVGRRRSATSRRKSWLSGNPSVTVAPSTAIGRHASIRGFVGGWRLIRATTSGHRRRSSTRGSSDADVGAVGPSATSTADATVERGSSAASGPPAARGATIERDGTADARALAGGAARGAGGAATC